MALAELFISIWTIVLCCGVVGSCWKSNPSTQVMPTQNPSGEHQTTFISDPAAIYNYQQNPYAPCKSLYTYNECLKKIFFKDYRFPIFSYLFLLEDNVRNVYQLLSTKFQFELWLNFVSLTNKIRTIKTD